MANNRMFLVHKESRKAVYLGKRIGITWRCSDNLQENLNLLFSEAIGDWGIDSFCLFFENSSDRETEWDGSNLEILKVKKDPVLEAAQRLIACQYDRDEMHSSGSIRCIDEHLVATEFLKLRKQLDDRMSKV